MVAIYPDEVRVDVTLLHAYEPADELREFRGTVLAPVGEDAEAPSQIGEVDGHVCISLLGRELRDAADGVDTDTELLGRLADEIVANLGSEVSSVVLLRAVRLLPPYRGQGLLGVVVDRLLDTLQLDPDATVVVAHPEPQADGGGPMHNGPTRDDALMRLRRSYGSSKFVQWADTVVWWRPIRGLQA